MPTYLYEHVESACSRGREFDHVQPMRDEKLSHCPDCGHPVRRLISPGIAYSAPKLDAELKNMGFTKLVRRDQGIYENVTALDGESRIWDADRPETMPDIGRRVED